MVQYRELAPVFLSGADYMENLDLPFSLPAQPV